MSKKLNKGVKAAAWFFYLVIVFEIIYMITPFLAFYYYPKYGPGLNFLQNSPLTSWLTGFFLPHYSESSSFFLNPQTTYTIGSVLFLAGLVIFLTGAGQIYYAKFAKKGAVVRGLYKYVRNPQYTAFSIMGLGVLLIWPRYIILVMYVTMLFVYYFLAKQEEKECEEKFGDSFRKYAAETSMFLPGRISLFSGKTLMPSSGPARVGAYTALYIVVMIAAVTAADGIRNYSLSTISAYFTPDTATVSPAAMDNETMKKTIDMAFDVPEVKEKLAAAGYGSGAKLLNYIVPREWILADLPLEEIPEGTHGHIHPADYNRDEYKVLFTIAEFPTGNPAEGVKILTNTTKRRPVVVVKLNIAEGKVLSVDTPPSHVAWGDIPTPLF